MDKLKGDHIISKLRSALEEISELTFGPHEKPHATIFKIIRVVKKAIGLEMPEAKLRELEENK